MRSIRRYLVVAALIILSAAFLVPPLASAENGGVSAPAIKEIAVAVLPPEARDTLALIKKGGPYPYPRDGAVFGNYERRLPLRNRGYYREYTVRTPGSNHRGARRLVVGNVEEYYYTDDHYRSYKRIRE